MTENRVAPEADLGNGESAGFYEVWRGSSANMVTVCSTVLDLYEFLEGCLVAGWTVAQLNDLAITWEEAEKPPTGLCSHCGGSLAIRNPSGVCDHLYYPENCAECKASNG